MKLQVQTIHQPQRLELVLAQFPGKATGDLIAELLNTLGQKGAVNFVIGITPNRKLGLKELGHGIGVLLTIFRPVPPERGAARPG
jgi:hypothetical protein